MDVLMRPPASSGDIGYWRQIAISCLGSVCSQWPRAGWADEGEYGASFNAGWSRRTIVVARRLSGEMARDLVRALERRELGQDLVTIPIRKNTTFLFAYYD